MGRGGALIRGRSLSGTGPIPGTRAGLGSKGVAWALRGGGARAWGRSPAGRGAGPQRSAASALSASPGCRLPGQARPRWSRSCCCGCWGCRGPGAQRRRSACTWAAAAGVSCASSARPQGGTSCECSWGLGPSRLRILRVIRGRVLQGRSRGPWGLGERGFGDWRRCLGGGGARGGAGA